MYTLYYTILYYTILYYTILYYTILYYTILYYTIDIKNVSMFSSCGAHKGPDTPNAIRQRDAIFFFSLTDNFDPSLNLPNL
jgi:hypothetical protein